MSEMKDRVAKVLFGWMHGHERWDDAKPEEREDCIEAACAVMEEMREPTSQQCECGAKRIMQECGEERGFSGPVAVLLWHDMIDEALK